MTTLLNNLTNGCGRQELVTEVTDSNPPYILNVIYTILIKESKTCSHNV